MSRMNMMLHIPTNTKGPYTLTLSNSIAPTFDTINTPTILSIFKLPIVPKVLETPMIVPLIPLLKLLNKSEYNYKVKCHVLPLYSSTNFQCLGKSSPNISLSSEYLAKM